MWRATDEVLARQVAVHTFAPGFPRTGEVVAAARAACRLSDLRLVQIFDADDRPGRPYLVTECSSGAHLGDLLTAGPLEPLRAAGIIADAADTLAAAHKAGLAHLCLTPDSLWFTAQGEVKVSGLGTMAALTGTQAADPALADTQGLARLLYTAVTGCWPGENQTALPPAPRSGGRASDPRLVRAGIPRDIDGVICRALFGESDGDGPPILGPAQLAMELASITQPGALPVAMTQALPPAPPLPPAAWPPWEDPTATSESVVGEPAQPVRRARRRGTAAKVLRAAALLALLAAIAACGWILAHQGTATHGAGGQAPAAGAAQAVGGEVHLRLTAPAPGRCVLAWFTRLPPDSSGTFRASFNNLRLAGQA